MDHRGRRVPVRFQLTTAECGPACLAMVLSGHGRRTTVPECRALVGAGRDGVTVDALAAAARRAGLEATVERSGTLPAMVRSPLVAYLARHHFVVVAAADRRWVSVVDPASGRLRLTRPEFEQLFGGTVLRLAPGPDFQKRRTRIRDRAAAQYVRQLVTDHATRRLTAFAIVLAALVQVFALAAPLLTREVVDDLIPRGHARSLSVLAFGIAAIAVVYSVLSLARGLVLLTIRSRGDRTMSGRFVDHLLRLPIGFFMDRGRGDLLLRMASVSATRETIAQQLMSTVIDSVLLSGYLIGIVVLEPWYAAVLLPLLVLQVGILVATHSRQRVLAQRELRAKTEEQSYLVEALQAIAPLKANGAEARVARRWRTLFDRYQRAVVERGRYQTAVTAARQSLTAVTPLVLLAFGAAMVLDGRMSLGDVLAVNGVALAVTAPLEALAVAGQMFQAVFAQIERVLDVLDTPPEASGQRVLPDRSARTVVFEQVGFAYPGADRAALEAVDLVVPAGAKLGVVGASGSGKSTLGLVALGLLPVTTGTARWDTVPMAELDIVAVRSECGAVLQDLTLFNGTLRDNLLLCRPEAEPAEMVRAAQIAGLHADVLALPMGYDTVVGEGGGALSAGQRQRVAIARALIHRPRVLLLDEATSHLDPITEAAVDAALSELAVTRIVISHRLSAVRNAAEIVVLDHGRIVQRGSHEELIGTPGKYRDLFWNAAALERPAPVEERI